MKLLATFLSLSIALLSPSVAFARECAGVRLPDSVQVAGQTLVLNGLGIREATALQVDVYVAGLYVPQRSRDVNAILAPDRPRRVVMRFVRDVSRSDAVEGFTTGFQRNSPSDLAALRPSIQRLTSMVSAMHEGDVVTITYVPGEGTAIDIAGRARGTIEGVLFGRAVFMNFIGPRPPNRGLRVGLLGGACE